MEPRSVLDSVHIFLCTFGRRLLRRFLRIKNCQDPLIFAIILVQSLVSASAGATPPLYGIVCGLLGWNSRGCGGYEVDMYLLCSPYPPCFVALFLLFFAAMAPIWTLPDAMGTSGCAESLPNYYFYL